MYAERIKVAKEKKLGMKENGIQTLIHTFRTTVIHAYRRTDRQICTLKDPKHGPCDTHTN